MGFKKKNRKNNLVLAIWVERKINTRMPYKPGWAVKSKSMQDDVLLKNMCSFICYLT